MVDAPIQLLVAMIMITASGQPGSTRFAAHLPCSSPLIGLREVCVHVASAFLVSTFILAMVHSNAGTPCIDRVLAAHVRIHTAK